MLHFSTVLKKFDQQGEKTGWTYFEVPATIASQLKQDTKKSFRVRGMLDQYHFAGVALVPVGGGDYIFAVNATMRKATKKKKGDTLEVAMEEDPEPPKISASLLECLEDEPQAKAYFITLAHSHQLYFTRWIDSAKTEATRIKRLALTINGLAQNKDFGQMLRDAKKDKALLG